jgi:hypothetical protein
MEQERNIKRYFTKHQCFQIDQQINANNIWTVAVELYPRRNKESIYSEKIQVQLALSEVSVLLDTLFMYRDSMELKNHGPDKDKIFSLKNNGPGLFVFMRQGKLNHQMNMVLDEDVRYDLITLVSDVLAKRDGVAIKDVLDISRSLAYRRHQLAIGQK